MSAASDVSHGPTRSGHADPAALAATLFARHRHLVYRHCLHRLRSTHDAEDALQQTFTNAVQALTAGIRPHHELAWLLKIAQNVCLDKTRNTTRRAQLEALQEPDSLADLATSRAPLRDERLDLVGSALSRLDPRQREALVLREWRGLSLQEIATVMQLTQSAVESLLFRARRSLARTLDDGRRLRATLNLGSLANTLRPLLNALGGKQAAITACFGLTLIAIPTLDHTLRHQLPQTPTTRAATAHSTTHHAPNTQPTTLRHVSTTPRTQPHAADNGRARPSRPATPAAQTTAPPTDTPPTSTADQPSRRRPATPATHPRTQTPPDPQTTPPATPRTAQINVAAGLTNTSLKTTLTTAGTTLDASITLGDPQQTTNTSTTSTQTQIPASNVEATTTVAAPTTQAQEASTAATTSTTNTSPTSTDTGPTGTLDAHLTLGLPTQ